MGILREHDSPRVRIDSGNVAENGFFLIRPAGQIQNDVRIPGIDRPVDCQIRVEPDAAGQYRALLKHNPVGIVHKHTVGHDRTAFHGQAINGSRLCDGNAASTGHRRISGNGSVLNRQLASAYYDVFHFLPGPQGGISVDQYSTQRRGIQIIINGALHKHESVHVSAGFDMDRQKGCVLVSINATAAQHFDSAYDTAPVQLDTGAAQDLKILRGSAAGHVHTAGGAYHGAPQKCAELHITVAERIDLGILDDAAAMNNNISVLPVGGGIQNHAGCMAAILNDQLTALDGNGRGFRFGGNPHVAVSVDLSIRDGCAAADRNIASIAGRNPIGALSIVKNGHFPIVDEDIVQFDPADRAIRLEHKTVQSAAGLHMDDSGALPLEHGCGIPCLDEQIFEDDGS